MECKRCGNKDPTYFYQGSSGLYCRKCVSFKRILLTEEIESQKYEIEENVANYNFKYPLTSFQKEASKETLEILLKNKDVLLYCVCGAGKTEIVVESISHFLKQQKKVCYAISRREVVKELELRFKEIFKDAKVIGVYGGHHDETSGDLIVCTTHQLFRYYQSFDLLILDEVDAFPLSGNDPLMNIALNSVNGNIIYSTATLNSFISKYLNLRPFEKVSLNIRPSLKPLIEPTVLKYPLFIHYFLLAKLMYQTTDQCIIFVSSKKRCRLLYFLYHFFFRCTYVYSDLVERNQNIKNFKEKKYQFIFSTSVLERGITIKDVDVVILFDREGAFTKASLIQMCGRVGRSITNPYGKATILSTISSIEIEKCQNEIRKANQSYEVSLLQQRNHQL